MASKSEALKEVLDLHFDERMKDVYTSIPAHVVAFDPKRQLAQIQLGILRVDRNGMKVPPPVIIDCPVLQYGTDNWTIEMQIDIGTEGMAMFSQRCVDGWLNMGGVADNPLTRFHDMQDCFFIPGFRPIPRAIKDFSQDGIQFRNGKGDQFVWLKNDKTIESNNGVGSIVLDKKGNVTVNGKFVIDVNGNVSMEGSLTVKGTITAEGNVVGAGVSLEGHTHGGVRSGGSNTSIPNK